MPLDRFTIMETVQMQLTRSDDRWQYFSKNVTGSGDALRIVNLSGEEYVSFVDDCIDFRLNHDWSMMGILPMRKRSPSF